MSAIEQLVGREILDSRGNPTVEVDVVSGVGRGRPGHGPVGRIDRAASKRSSCATAATRYRRQGRAHGAVGHVNGEIADAIEGHGRRSTSGPSTWP